MSTPATSKGTSRIDPLVGTLLAGKYKIIKKIGEGGMGSVYIADQQPIDRKVAVKVLLGKLAEDDVAVKRFEQEARAISKMQHPNTVTIYDFGQTEDQQLYIVMEYLKGKTLTQVLRNEGVLAAQRAAKIIRQVCGSLKDAHTAGIIHRDLKPDNIFLTDVGGDPDWVKVLDFGVAKLADSEGGTLTQTGMIFGTPKYMSPEQAEGRPIDYRADIYALGVVLYELLVGRPPFIADTPVGLLLKHISEPPPPFQRVRPDLSIDPRIEQIAMKALEKNPDRRQQMVGELAQELESFERAVSGGVMVPGMVGGAYTAPQPVPGLPTEVVPGATPGSPHTPAGLRPPNQVPGNLSLSVPSQTRDVAVPTGVATAQQQLQMTGGQHPTSLSTAAHDALPTTAQGVMPFAAGGGTAALTSPIPAPGGGVDTLGGVGGIGSTALKPPAKPKPALLYGGVGLVVVAGGLFAFAMQQSRGIEETPIHEAPTQPQPATAQTQVPATTPQTAQPKTEPEQHAAAEVKTVEPEKAPTRDTPVRPQPQRPTETGKAREVVEAPSATVQLRVESSPPGASVLLDGSQAGTTPFTTAVPRNEPVTFVFKKAGFQDLTRGVRPANDQTVAVELVKLPEPTSPTPQTDVKTEVRATETKATPKKPDKVDPNKLDEKVDDLK